MISRRPLEETQKVLHEGQSVFVKVLEVSSADDNRVLLSMHTKDCHVGGSDASVAILENHMSALSHLRDIYSRFRGTWFCIFWWVIQGFMELKITSIEFLTVFCNLKTTKSFAIFREIAFFWACASRTVTWVEVTSFAWDLHEIQRYVSGMFWLLIGKCGRYEIHGVFTPWSIFFSLIKSVKCL